MPRSATAAPEARATRALLRCGLAAGPFYVLLGLAQILTREGFDVRRHALSLLSNGEYGWVQTASFLVTGVLVMAGAAGVRRALRGTRAGTWGPILLAVYGIGMIGAGFFPADPGNGFPPGTVASSTMSRAGFLHFAFGGTGFYALIAACFVFARRFFSDGRRAWGAWSAFTGAAFFCAFAAIAAGSTAAAVMLAFYAAVAWIWVWHTALYSELLRGTSRGSAEAVESRVRASSIG